MAYRWATWQPETIGDVHSEQETATEGMIVRKSDGAG